MKDWSQITVTPKDTQTCLRLFAILIAGVVVSLAVMIACGWSPIALLFADKTSAQAVTSARLTMSLCFAIAGFYIALRSHTEIPVTYGAYTLFLVIATTSLNQVYQRHYSRPCYDTDSYLAMLFLLPSLAGFLLGFTIRRLKNK